ncbi:MAG: GlsB/YeaQ/YmgE family stress response membrane protein [Planctomycetaceae bacterium]
MGILSWIVFGLIAGALAKWIMPGNDPGGIIVTIILGVVGGIVGGYLGTVLGWGAISGFDLRSFFLAIVGSMLLLTAYRFLKGGRVGS